MIDEDEPNNAINTSATITNTSGPDSKDNVQLTRINLTKAALHPLKSFTTDNLTGVACNQKLQKRSRNSSLSIDNPTSSTGNANMARSTPPPSASHMMNSTGNASSSNTLTKQQNIDNLNAITFSKSLVGQPGLNNLPAKCKAYFSTLDS